MIFLDKMKRLIDEAKKMISLNSVTSNGNEELANYVAGLMRERGIRPQLQQVTHSMEGISKRQFNVIGIIGDPLVDRKIRKGLLLTSHLDTASPGLKENWTETAGEPFTATIKERKIFGLGTADAKLDFLCKIHAAGRLREKKLHSPLYLVGTCGQELGMFGAKYLIKALSLNPKHVLVGEPTDLRLVHAHKCDATFRISIGYQQVEKDARGFNRRIQLQSFGVSAHAAYPENGKNAILGLMDFLQRAVDSGFELRFTDFQGGDTANKVPDSASTKFYLTSHQLEDFKRFFREMVRVEGNEKAFRVELGGVGETGVRFLPDSVFACTSEIVGLFEKIAADLNKVKDESFSPAHSTINFGRLTQRPGAIDLSFDMRLLPDLALKEIEKHIGDGVQKIAKGYPSLNLSSGQERMNPGLNLNTEGPLARTCSEIQKSADISPEFSKRSISTEAAQFSQA